MLLGLDLKYNIIIYRYDEEKAALDALQEKMDEQDEEYAVLMREKEEEEMRIFEIKALEFLRNRAARKIQRAWRRYKERKELRKKRRKGNYYSLVTFGKFYQNFF